ncbi:hypothetical protein OJ252_3307 [Cryptosporidium canis]|uniref:Uncharacterized protein n=1 Tax=Cryptosporidium canis TaxID=195482 RepID=A0ABQ8P2R0_9CRYT|nr:hypothetical protein OJ252_3307 [Cryptosporidium canis]
MEVPNYNVMSGMEISRRGVRMSRRALLVSGESGDLRGCTNDIIEYAILLSNVYQYKEIRILLSEKSEMLYGNFISLALSRIDGGVVQIIRLSSKSLKEGFQWLLVSVDGGNMMGSNQGYYFDYTNMYRMEDTGNVLSSFLDLVFVYCGPVRLLKENKDDPCIVISKRVVEEDKEEEEFFRFSEFERMISEMESNLNNRGNLTCFLDCNYSYLFLSKYTTRGDKEFNQGVGLNHVRTLTAPGVSRGEDRVIGAINPRLSVILLGSCSSSMQNSQEIKVLSTNGIGLSIIYRGLFSYCLQSVIRNNSINMVNGRFQNSPRITLKYLMEETSRSMFHFSIRNQLNNQIPIILASKVGVSLQERVLLDNRDLMNSLKMLDYRDKDMLLSPMMNMSGFSNNNMMAHPLKIPIKNLNIGIKRVNNYNEREGGRMYGDEMVKENHMNMSNHSNLIQEINSLRSELSYLKQSIHSENIARDFNNRRSVNQAYSPVQIFNSEAIFKKSVKPSYMVHHRTLTFK